MQNQTVRTQELWNTLLTISTVVAVSGLLSYMVYKTFRAEKEEEVFEFTGAAGLAQAVAMLV